MRKEAKESIDVAAHRLIDVLSDMAERLPMAGHDANKYALRLQFGLGRLADLQRDAAAAGGVFAAARVEIALTILETHIRTAADFIERTMIPKRRAPKTRAAFAAADDAVSAYEEYRRAA